MSINKDLSLNTDVDKSLKLNLKILEKPSVQIWDPTPHEAARTSQKDKKASIISAKQFVLFGDKNQEKPQSIEKFDDLKSNVSLTKASVKRTTKTKSNSKAPLLEQDMEHKVISIIKSCCVYTSLSEKNNDAPQIKKQVEKTFRSIAICGENNSADKNVKNMRLNKPILKAYLSKRYNKRLANKICALFDWSN